MAMVTRNPLCDFRALAYPIAGVKATATTTAPVAQTNPAGNNVVPYLVIQDITACLVGGTAAEGASRVNLIDGTTGGTNIVWSGALAAGIGGVGALAMNYLNIPCKSGFATLEFAAAGGTTGQQSVAMGGYFGGGYGGQ